jgi:hypothetical protein
MPSGYKPIGPVSIICNEAAYIAATLRGGTGAAKGARR